MTRTIPRLPLAVAARTLGATATMAAAAGLVGYRRRARTDRLHDLLGRRGGPFSLAHGVDGPRVVGMARNQAFVHDGTRLAWLVGLGAGRALDVRDDVVVGGSYGLASPRQPWRWRGTVGAPLPLPDGAVTGEATALNDSGWVAGTGWSAGGTCTRAVRWDRNDCPTLLEPPGGDRSEAAAVLVDGRVVGSGTDRHGVLRPCMWDLDGAPRMLHALTDGNAAIADADDHGRLVGWAEIDDGVMRACIWDLDGRAHALPSVAGLRSRANAVQPRGVIVGATVTERGHLEACLWNEDGTLRLLGTLGGTTSEALSVSVTGKVVGVASTGAGASGLRLRPGGWSWEEHAFIAEPQRDTDRSTALGS
jgi:uncharacterized membrane protein